MELQRLYTDNAGAQQYSAETVKLFRRRIRHLEAAADLNDLRCPSLVHYQQLSTDYPPTSSLTLDGEWTLIISEELQREPKRIVVLEVSRRGVEL